MALELTKYEVTVTANDMVQLDVSTLDDSIFVSLVLSKNAAGSLVQSINDAIGQSEGTRYSICGATLKSEDLKKVLVLLRSINTSEFSPKIEAIKHIRTVYLCGLREAKELVDLIQQDLREGKIPYGY